MLDFIMKKIHFLQHEFKTLEILDNITKLCTFLPLTG